VVVRVGNLHALVVSVGGGGRLGEDARRVEDVEPLHGEVELGGRAGLGARGVCASAEVVIKLVRQ